MSRLPSPRTLPSPYVVSAPQEVAFWGGLVVATSAWPTANRALWTSLHLPSTVRLNSVSVWCGATGSGTFDLGIYDSLGTTRMASLGSTSLVATSINTWTLATPILLEAGVRYYLGMSCSTVSATIRRMAPTALSLRAAGAFQQATAHPLPAPSTPAQATSAYTPVFALTFV